jgi:hypothetical protein
MRRLLSVIHILLVLAAFILCTVRSQAIIEIIPYRIIPAYDGCDVEIEIINPITDDGIISFHASETKEIILDRIIYELTSPLTYNDVFTIDGKPYYLIRIPYTGATWK